MQLHDSVIFTSCGNVKIQICVIPSRLRNGNVKSRFRHILGHQISAVVRFRHVSANGSAVVCCIYQNTNATWFFEQQ